MNPVSVVYERELGLSAVVCCIVESPWFPRRSSIRNSFISRVENTCLCILCTLFGSSCCSRLEDVTLHGDCQLCQRLYAILRGRVVNISVSVTERSATADVVRSMCQSSPRRFARPTTTPRRAITMSHDQTRSATMLVRIELMTRIPDIDLDSRYRRTKNNELRILLFSRWEIRP